MARRLSIRTSGRRSDLEKVSQTGSIGPSIRYKRPGHLRLTGRGAQLVERPWRHAYQPVAAMIGALRCWPAMLPSLGASPKG